jgi:hypothetical protein
VPRILNTRILSSKFSASPHFRSGSCRISQWQSPCRGNCTVVYFRNIRYLRHMIIPKHRPTQLLFECTARGKLQSHATSTGHHFWCSRETAGWGRTSAPSSVFPSQYGDDRTKISEAPSLGRLTCLLRWKVLVRLSLYSCSAMRTLFQTLYSSGHVRDEPTCMLHANLWELNCLAKSIPILLRLVGVLKGFGDGLLNTGDVQSSTWLPSWFETLLSRTAVCTSRLHRS